MSYFQECMLSDRIDPIWVEGAILEIEKNAIAREELIALIGVYIYRGKCTEPRKCLNLLIERGVVKI